MDTLRDVLSESINLDTISNLKHKMHTALAMLESTKNLSQNFFEPFSGGSQPWPHLLISKLLLVRAFWPMDTPPDEADSLKAWWTKNYPAKDKELIKTFY